MRIIGNGVAQIALAVDEQQRLLGTITDGDIRRSLLHGETLETHGTADELPVSFVRSGDDQAAVLEMMRREVLRHTPVLDEHGKVVELLLQSSWRQLWLPNAVVIMAGGKCPVCGYTEHCLTDAPVDGKPMLEIVLTMRILVFRFICLSTI